MATPVPTLSRTRDVAVEALTVMSHSALMESEILAVILTVPPALAVTIPPSTVALDSSEEIHSHGVLEFAGVRVAVNVSVSPTSSSAVVLSNAIAVVATATTLVMIP